MKQQQGIAIVSVLVVVAIIAGIASSVMLDQQLLIRRAENQLHGNQAILHLVSLETYAKEVLIQDHEDNPDEDTPEEAWATPLLPVETDGGVVSGYLEDLQARFNLNAVVDRTGKPVEAARQQFECLVSRVAPEELDAASLASALVDWLDGDQNAGQGGAEDLDYLGLDPAYRTASRPMASATELRLVQGMNAEGWKLLSPFVTALPDFEATINVNTASIELITCLDEEIDDSLAQQIVEERKVGTYYSSWDSFLGKIKPAYAPEAEIKQEELRVGFASSYFQLHSFSSFGEISLSMRQLINRNEREARTLMREFGADK
jgi:general secretion pathway protein K